MSKGHPTAIHSKNKVEQLKLLFPVIVDITDFVFVVRHMKFLSLASDYSEQKSYLKLQAPGKLY